MAKQFAQARHTVCTNCKKVSLMCQREWRKGAGKSQKASKDAPSRAKKLLKEVGEMMCLCVLGMSLCMYVCTCACVWVDEIVYLRVYVCLCFSYLLVCMSVCVHVCVHNCVVCMYHSVYYATTVCNSLSNSVCSHCG